MTQNSDISAEFPFTSRYIQILDTNIHYIDEGSGDPILFLHGNPTSSYLWRNIIPYLIPNALCIAPDLIGMGKSDKPDIEYRFFDHVKYIEEFIAQLGLKNITLVIHDWGSAIGFHYAMRNEANIKALAFMEAIIMPIPNWDLFNENAKSVFQGFRTPDVGWEMIGIKNMFVERMLPGAVVRQLNEEEMNIYREPFLEIESRKPVWMWPNEIPVAGEPKDVVEVVNSYNQKLQESDLPKLLFFADDGFLIPKSVVEWCKSHLKNLRLVDVGPGIHFIQEDHPHLIGEELSKWYSSL